MNVAKQVKQKSKNSVRRRTALLEGNVEYLARRAEIIATAATLFKERGYDGTSFNDISTFAGIERAALYYYFGSKEEIFREACKGTFDRNLADIETISSLPSLTASQKLGMVMERLMIYFEESYPYPYIYLQERASSLASNDDPWAKEMIARTRQVEGAYKALIEAAIRSDELRDDIPVTLAANAIFGMLNWTHQWYTPDGKYKAKDISVAFRKIFFEGMQRRGNLPGAND